MLKSDEFNFIKILKLLLHPKTTTFCFLNLKNLLA